MLVLSRKSGENIALPPYQLVHPLPRQAHHPTCRRDRLPLGSHPQNDLDLVAVDTVLPARPASTPLFPIGLGHGGRRPYSFGPEFGFVLGDAGCQPSGWRARTVSIRRKFVTQDTPSLCTCEDSISGC